MQRILLGLLALGVGACAPIVRNDEASNYFALGQGASVTLRQPLEVPPRELRTFVQFGQPVARKAVNPWHPNCHFELTTLTDAQRSLGPQGFRLARLERRLGTLAASGLQVQVAGLFGQGAELVNFETRLFLQPDDPANEVRRLNCAVWALQGEGDHLRLAEIRAALGDTAHLDPGW